MTQIPIISGIFADVSPDFRTTYPHNLIPVPKPTGIASGYLRPAEGLDLFTTGEGADRGGIEWEGVLYRVQGTKFVSISEAGTVTVIGDVGSGGPVTMDYSFDYLGIASGGRMYLYDGATLTQITDADLGSVDSFVWLDGYFVTTDGEFIVVTELTDPFAVNPLKYGSSEIDPDPIQRLLELRNELYAVNRHTIEVFDNVGSAGFPFQRIEGAQIERGAVGTHAATVFNEAIAFVGGARGEAPGVFIANNGRSQKISTREIDKILAGYSDLSEVVVEERRFSSHIWLYIHLADQTLVYDAAATAIMERPIWFTLSGGASDKKQYPARSFTWAYDKWIAGDPTQARVAEVSDEVSSHYGEKVGWDFGVSVIYNENRGVIVHSVELVALTGSTALGKDPTISTEYSEDGLTWSQPRYIKAGKQGARTKRLEWRRQGRFGEWRTQRFRGTSDAHITVSRVDMEFEGLAW